MSPTRRRTASLALVAVALVAAGCGSTDSSTSRSAQTSTAATPSSTPTGPSYPPADGPKVRLRSFTARAPSRWKLDHSLGQGIVFADDPHYRDEITFSDTTIYPGTSLTRAERIVSRDDTWTRTPRSLPRVTLDGQTFFHLAGPAEGGRRYEAYGLVAGDRVLQLSFDTDESPAVRERLSARCWRRCGCGERSGRIASLGAYVVLPGRATAEVAVDGGPGPTRETTAAPPFGTGCRIGGLWIDVQVTRKQSLTWSEEAMTTTLFRSTGAADRAFGGTHRDDLLDQLSPRELEVLALMAEGRSNRAIGERLTVELKTVETHVGRVFTKLGLSEDRHENRRVLAVLTFFGRQSTDAGR